MKKTVQTPYGETTIEVVECDSCGSEIDKESASKFMMVSGESEIFENAQRSGYACDYCVDEGPISYPKKKVSKLRVNLDNGGLVFGVLLWPLMALACIIDPNKKSDVYYAISAIGAVLWLVSGAIGAIMELV